MSAKTDDASNAGRVDLARAEFGRWMTGIDSRRSASQRFQVLRRDGEAYDEISVHPSIQEARDVCSREAWKAAFQAADAPAGKAEPAPVAVDVGEALKRMLDHSCVADAAPEDKFPEDHEAERMARAAIRQLASAPLAVPAELRDLSAKACQGDWTAAPFLDDRGNPLGEGHWWIQGGWGNLGGDFDEADAKLVAAAVNDTRARIAAEDAQNAGHEVRT